MTKEHTVTIPETSENERLDQALAKLLPEYSRTQIKEWIENGSAKLNGEAVKAKTKVRAGDVVAIIAELKAQPAWEAQSIPLNIIHEDEDIIIINKPAGLVVHPGAGNTNSTLLNALLHHAPLLGELPRAGILHRLDKDTSGLLVIAKTAPSYRQLNTMLKNREISREYRAIVYGALISGKTVDAPIGRHPLQRKKMAVNDDGKPAITHYRIGEKFRHHTLLNVKLETGRTHQIRVHLSHSKHPIVGDVLYGGRVQLSKNMSDELITCLRQFKRQALHAFRLGFIHPTKNEHMEWEAPIPDDMLALLALLRDDLKRNEE